jgi:hypothetical protein
MDPRELQENLDLISQQAIERNFEAAWRLYNETLCAVDANGSTLAPWGIKRLCRAWFNLGRNSAESGVGAQLMSMNVSTPPTEEK